MSDEPTVLKECHNAIKDMNERLDKFITGLKEKYGSDIIRYNKSEIKLVFESHIPSGYHEGPAIELVLNARFLYIPDSDQD